MADLSSAITRTGVSGGVKKFGSFAAKALFVIAVSDTASLQVTEASEVMEARAGYSQTFTRVGVSGGVKRYGDFSKQSETLAGVEVSDTAYLSGVENPFDEQSIATYDAARLSVSESASIFRFIPATDNAQLGLSETVSLLISGVLLKPVSDTASIEATESLGLSVTLEVTDSADLDVTDSSDLEATNVAEAVSDTASLNLDESTLLNVFSGIVGGQCQ